MKQVDDAGLCVLKSSFQHSRRMLQQLLNRIQIHIYSWQKLDVKFKIQLVTYQKI